MTTQDPFVEIWHKASGCEEVKATSRQKNGSNRDTRAGSPHIKREATQEKTN